MKKYSITFLLITLLVLTVNINKSLGNIKFVQASKMQQINHISTVNVTGEFKNSDETYIRLSAPVCIKDVFVKENSYVNRGQALFSIDKAKMVSLLTGGITDELLSSVTDTDLTRLKSRYNSFTENSIFNLPDTVYAGENGIISRITVFPGGIALPNQDLMVINHTDDIVAKFTLSQLDYGKIAIGDKVEINPLAFSNVTYTGTITDDNAVIKKQGSLTGNKTVIDVFAKIENADKKVAAGLQINGVIYCGQEQTINALEYNYIYQDNKTQYVYVLENGRAVRKDIETGTETNEYTQVLTQFSDNTIFLCGDITDGDRVIISE